MFTNLIQLLHTTAAYQAAALQLMVAQASFTAQKLGLHEPMPLVLAVEANAELISVPMLGVGGEMMTSNYVYEFQHGHVTYLKRRSSGVVSGVPTNGKETSVMDTNSALRLAENDLTVLGVDVVRMNRRFSAHVAQMSSSTKMTNQDGKTSSLAKPPTRFKLMWYKEPFNGVAPIRMDLSENELLSCQILDRRVFTNAPLKLTNAAALLGPTPTPVEFVKKFFGGQDAYDTVASPDTTEAWLLNAFEDESGKIENLQHEGLTKIKPRTAKKISNVLLDFDTYEWTVSKMCGPNFRLGLRFTRGVDVVEVLFCFGCDVIHVTHKDREKDENIDLGHNKLVKLAQRIFPDDPTMRDLKPVDENEKHNEFENPIKSYEQN